MDLLVSVCVFAVTDACSGRGHLEVAAFENFLVAQGVITTCISFVSRSSDLTRNDMYALLQLSRNDVGKDLKFAVWVCPEACVWLYTIFVDNSQGAELVVPAVKVAVATN